MLAFSPQLFGAPHEYRPHVLHERSGCSEAAPQGRYSKIKTCSKRGKSWKGPGHNSMCLRCKYHHSAHRRLRSLPLLLGSLVLLCSIGGKAAVGGPPTDPPEQPGPSGRHADGDTRSEQGASGGSGDRVEANSPAKKTARRLPEVQQSLWQPVQQQPTEPREHAVDSAMSSWKDLFRFFEPLHQQTLQNMKGQSPVHRSGKVPQAQSNVKGTSSRVVPEARRPVTSQQSAPKGKEPSANGLATGKPSAAGSSPSSQAASSMFQLSWLSPERPLTREEEEEEALADAIIHGTSKKRVPRVRTAVDTLIDAIEEEKLQQVAKSPRQLEVLRERRKADMQAQKPTVQMPEYFVMLAKEAAAFHQKQAQLQQQKKNKPVGVLGERMRTLALRQHQKDKLMNWRENQIFQLPEDGPEFEKLIEDARKTDRELSRTLLRDLPPEDLSWAIDTEEPPEEAYGSAVDTAGKGRR